MAILNNSNAISSVVGGYDINNSLRFRSSASAFLSRTPSVSGNRRTWTWSAWVKRGSLGSAQVLFGAGFNNGSAADELVSIGFTANDQLQHYVVETGVTDRNNSSTAVYRDPSAWYHIVAIYDSTQATASNRQRLFVNGVEITAWSSTSYVNQNYQPSVNSNAYPHAIGKYGFNNTRYFDGYMADINFIDGQALTPSSFGETDTTTGVWKPKAYTGTYGTNGFYLKFSDIATTSGSNAGLGRDFSGNGNFWNTNNISVTSGVTYDAMTDSPTLTSATVANYCVINPIDRNAGSVTNGNLTFTDAGADGWDNARGTMLVSSGKWYWEMTATNVVTSVLCASIASPRFPLGNLPGQNSVFGVTYYTTGNAYFNSNGGGVGYGSTWTTGDIIGIALDMDTGKVWFSKNGTWQASGDPAAGTNAAYSSLLTHDTTWGPITGTFYSGSIANYNFGQRPFAYTPPTGFNRLNTFNLPTSTIVKGNSYMDATLYTGNGSSQTIVNAGGFRPDLVWAKNRNTGSTTHGLFDSVRGVTAYLSSNNTNAEANLSGVTSFNSNGFSLGADWNQNTNTFVGWQWQAGSSTVTNTSGTISSQVRANTTAGFSIATFTAPSTNQSFTVGHGLGVAPRMTIVKRRDSSFGASWWVWHIGLGDNTSSYLVLNSTNAAATEPSMWGTVGRTSTVCGFNAPASIITSGTYVLYSFAEIAGFSRFGSYTGNGSTDGPFVYLGFRPKYLMIKVTSTTEQWAIKDTSRVTYNTNNTQLFANAADAEDTNNTFHMIDFLSNGFKMRGAAQNLVNGSGQNYIYMAFAENPFKNSLAR